MNRITASVILKSFVAGLLLSGCGGFGSYVPQVRDVTERPITGDYWSQQFTLYEGRAMGSRVGQWGRVFTFAVLIEGLV